MRQDNLVCFIKKQLAESSIAPESQLQEILTMILEEGRWEDFRPSYLPDLFESMNKKLDQINEKMLQIENESETYQSELAAMKAGGSDRREEVEYERRQREMLEEDYNLISEQLQNLTQRYTVVNKLEERNA